LWEGDGGGVSGRGSVGVCVGRGGPEVFRGGVGLWGGGESGSCRQKAIMGYSLCEDSLSAN